jgi:L-iditol 2-dehydrogenase
MKAYTYTGEGRLELQERAKPRISEDTAVVRILAAAICGTDLRTYRHGSHRIQPPRVIGHEACGVLEDLGRQVKGFRPGERVMVVPAVGCGVCRWCRAGRTNMCESLRTVGFDYDGTFAQYMEIPAQAIAMGNVLRVPDGVPTPAAVLAEPAACCVNGQEFLQIGPEDLVFIFGAGFIGCVHAELALRKKAKVIISDITNGRLQEARRLLPAVETVNTANADAQTLVRERTAGRGADVIITACPSGQAHTAAMQMAATRARISLFGGIPGDGKGYLDSNAIHYKELSVFGSHATSVSQVRRVLGWLAAGELDLGKYVSASYPLAEIQEAFEALRSEKVLKVLIVPGEGSLL